MVSFTGLTGGIFGKVTGDIPDGYDVFLIAGQSNSYSGEEEVGQTLPESPQDDTDANIFQIGRFDGFDNQVITAEEPLDHVGYLGVRPDADLVGWALAFAKMYKTQGYLRGNRNILLVPAGEGGTGFAGGDWNKGDTNYNDAIARVNVAMSAGSGTNYLEGILWHQGESDTASTANANAHKAALLQMIDDMRTDLNAPEVPFVAGGMVPNWVNNIGDATTISNKQTVQSGIADIVNQRTYTGYANPSSPTELVASATDENNHFKADDMRGASQDFTDYTTLGMAGRYWVGFVSALTNI